MSAAQPSGMLQINQPSDTQYANLMDIQNLGPSEHIFTQQVEPFHNQFSNFHSNHACHQDQYQQDQYDTALEEYHGGPDLFDTHIQVEQPSLNSVQGVQNFEDPQGMVITMDKPSVDTAIDADFERAFF